MSTRDTVGRRACPDSVGGEEAKTATVTLVAEGKLAEEIADSLGELGWRVRRVGTLDDLERPRADAVIAAHDLGAGRPEELCQRALSGVRTGALPLLVVIGAPAEQRAAYLDAGADDAVGTEVGAEEIVARLQALLRRSRSDRDRSPLTGLPGNTRLEQVLRERLADGETPAVLMLDIDNFKAFNDRYGHWRGDQVIQMLADIARQAAAADREALVAHVGGDDLFVVTRPELVNDIARECKEQFDAQAPRHYDESDRQRGYVSTHSRAGRRRQFGLMTLTLVAATAEAEDMRHIGQFFQVLAELKEYAKGQPGSTYIRDRRRHHGWDDSGRPARRPTAP